MMQVWDAGNPTLQESWTDRLLSILYDIKVKVLTSRNAIRACCAALAVLAAALSWWVRPIMAFLDLHPGTAAWVQAVGAILILGATALIAGRDSREREREKLWAQEQLWRSIAALSDNCMDAIDGVLQKHSPLGSADVRENFVRLYVPSDLDVPIDGLAAIPLREIGDTTLLTAVLKMRGIMGGLKSILTMS